MPNAFHPSCEFSFDILSDETIARLEALANKRGIDVQKLITHIIDRQLAREMNQLV
jgi:hypothetical protein